MHTARARGVDHVGLTVPDLAAAHRFLIDGLGAEFLYEVLGRKDPPLQGKEMEQAVALPEGTKIFTVRMYRLGNGPGIELFEYQATTQHLAARACDFGWQHIALYVDDMENTARRAVAAGAVQLGAPWNLMGPESGAGAAFCFLRAPFGALIELVTYPSAQTYEATTSLRRWKPPGDPSSST